MAEQDISRELSESVQQARAEKAPLRLIGGDSKAFYGRQGTAGSPLHLADHAGITSYEPTELVLTARAGTRIDEIERVLAERGQMLAFEPPYFAQETTLGGAVAAGLGGPRRPWGGAPRDLVLGVRILDGLGQILNFGGQVMKNVAGYDVSRLMAGSLGTLGILLQVSLKVLPRPQAEVTRMLELDRDGAMQRMRELARRPAPLSGAAYLDGRLYLRLTGNQAAVDEWLSKIGGEQANNQFWFDLRDQRLSFFTNTKRLWRLSLPPAGPPLACEQTVLVDWAGAQRWVITDTYPHEVRKQAAQANGHAVLYRGAEDGEQVFQERDAVSMRIHKNLKEKFDPDGILNPGRMYEEF